MLIGAAGLYWAWVFIARAPALALPVALRCRSRHAADVRVAWRV